MTMNQFVESAFSLKDVVSSDSVCAYTCNEINKRYEKDCLLGCWNELSKLASLFLKKHGTTLENEEYAEECFKIKNMLLLNLNKSIIFSPTHKAF